MHFAEKSSVNNVANYALLRYKILDWNGGVKFWTNIMHRMYELEAVTCCKGTSDIYVIILQRIYWCMNGAMFHNGYSSATRNMRSNFYNESADKNKTIFWIMRLKYKHNELRHTNCKLHFDCGDFSWRIPAIFTKKSSDMYLHL